MRQSNGETIILIGCGKRKRTGPAPAALLYASPFFREHLAWAKTMGCSIWILSAKHGLVHPDTVIEPYELSMYQFSLKMAREWGESVLRQLLQLPTVPGKLVIMAGWRYVAPLQRAMSRLPSTARLVIETPAAGLEIGERRRWMRDDLRRRGIDPGSVFVLTRADRKEKNLCLICGHRPARVRLKSRVCLICAKRRAAHRMGLEKGRAA